MPKKRTWIVVADAARVRTYAMVGANGTPSEVEGGCFDNATLLQHARDAGSDRPGRTIDSAGSARHAQDAKTDPHRRAKGQFATLAADMLEMRHREFDALVVVAPPQFLGDLRKAVGSQTVKRLVREVDKDLTKAPAQELRRTLRELTLPQT